MLLVAEPPSRPYNAKAAQIKEAPLERCKTTPVRPKQNHPLKFPRREKGVQNRKQTKRHRLHVRESVESILFQCRRPRHQLLFVSDAETRGTLYSNTYRLLLNVCQLRFYREICKSFILLLSMLAAIMCNVHTLTSETKVVLL